MAATKFTSDNRKAVVGLFRSGLSLKDVARVAGVREKTLKGWLTRGRKETSGSYREFADAIDLARREADAREKPLTRRELKLLVSRAAKAGSVAAQKLYWEILRADAGDDDQQDPFDELDAAARSMAAPGERSK